MEQVFTHGSEDSLDHDVYVIFDHIPSFKEVKLQTTIINYKTV